MASSQRTGVLLINLGTPRTPAPGDVGEYLREFLMDPFVIDIPVVWRWLLVNVAIVPRRSRASGALYEKIWTDRGSPLLFHTLDLAKKVQAVLGESFIVEPCMRYGEPSVQGAVEKLTALGIRNFVAFPLYPQYSLAATESSIAEVRRALQSTSTPETVEFVPPFYADEGYLGAVTEVSRGPLEAARADHVLFSFHGLPEKHVHKTDLSGNLCLNFSHCCDTITKTNQLCYRAQSFATARSLAKRLGLAESKYHVSFQSRLNDRWIKPYTDEYYRTLPKQGVKRLAVLCPSFVADCLETLEEVRLRGNEEFRRHGGEEVVLIPSLNASDHWAAAVAELSKRHAV